MLNFVYCEWIDGQRMLKSLPTAEYVSIADLEDHRLAFVAYVETGTEAPGVGGCHLLEESGSTVPGVLYELDEDAQVEADRLCRIDEGRYRRATYSVRTPDGEVHEALTYIIANPTAESAPSQEYVQHMVQGAADRGFPREYIAELEGMLE